MDNCSIVSMFIAPAIAIALYVLLKYKYPKGSFKLVYQCFMLGVSGIIVVYFADRIIESLHLNSLHSVNRTLFYSFVLTTGLYELVKLVFLRLLVYKSHMVRRPIDMIVYTIFIFTGFNTAFSIYRIFFGPEYVNDCIYAFSVGPAVVSLAIIMGYFVGQARGRRYNFVDLFTALLITVVFNGLFYFCILTSDLPLLYLSIAGMVIVALPLLFITLKQKDALY